MFIFMIILFVLGYVIIALEHPLKINKTATALLLAAGMWTCTVIGGENLIQNTSGLRDYLMLNPGTSFSDWLIQHKLIEVLGDVSQIIFFLLGAMTIVELIDTQGGFTAITEKIKTTKKVKLLWVLSILTFFMSAILDNMTTSIVMVALLRKIIGDKKDRWFYASMVIIAANSGGAWSPIGDVTTIMLWIAGKVSTINIIEMTFLASLVSLVVPLIVLSFVMKGEIQRPVLTDEDFREQSVPQWQKNLFLILGVACLLFVPVFKTLTHLPPYLGMLGGLSIMWITSEIVHWKNTPEEKSKYSINQVLTRVDVPSVLFFLGILLAVNALQVVGHLELLAANLDRIPMQEPGKYYVINMIIGVLSSVVDNVPLVAGAMGMYNFPIDHYFWEFLAYCAGTGGSILIIGSAAGVAVMGMEKIDFIWYFKKISWIALIGYFAGCGFFILEKSVRSSFENHETTVNNEVIMTEEGVKDYLMHNSFYMEEQDSYYRTNNDINFIEYKDLKSNINYTGIYSKTSYDNITAKDTLYSYAFGANLAVGDVTIQIQDTIAYIDIAESQLILTKSGQLGVVSEYGLYPLKKR